MSNNREKERRISYIGVYGVAIKEKKILLTKKDESSYYRGLWDLPGGGIEFGETAEQTLRREFKEEVGLQFSHMHWIANLSYTGSDPAHSLIFHHLGQIYLVEECLAIPNIKGEDPHQWHSIEGIDWNRLTPFAREGLQAVI